MADDPLFLIAETFTLVGVLVAFAIFARLALKARSLGSFRFQLSIFILIWAIAEVLHIAESLGLASQGSLDDLGLGIHMVSMAAFAIFLGSKSYGFLRIRPLPPLLPLPKPQGVTGAIDE